MTTMPHDTETERRVLHGCFTADDAVETAVGILRAEDFYSERHQAIYRAILENFEVGQTVDAATIAERLDGDMGRPGVSYAATIAEILDFTPGPGQGSGEHLCRIVADRAALRRLAEHGNAIFKRATAPGADVTVVAEFVRQAIDSTETAGRECPAVLISEVAGDAFDEIEQRVANQGRLLGVPTGFLRLDRVLLGFQAGDLIIIAARPSMGKTALMLSMVMAAANESTPVCFSLEMDKRQLYFRMLSAISGVFLQGIRSGGLSRGDMDRVTAAAGRIHDMQIVVDDSSGLTVSEIRRRLRQIRRKHGRLGPVFIDYLQLMRTDRRRGERHDLEIGDISAGLKAIAKDFQVPVIVLSQLNRKLEDRTEKRPKLSDLRESGALEQDADIVLFPYRPEVYIEPKYDDQGLMTDKFSKVRGTAELIISKHRNGPTGMIPLVWIEDRACFQEVAR
ncbi:MAG: replicative DNA helicase [Pseudomonadota bacterium]